MMLPIAIEWIGKDAAEANIRALAQVVLDAIESNAGVSFMSGLTQAAAEAWWRAAVTTPRAIALVARDCDIVVGTVQIQPSWAPTSRTVATSRN